MVESLHQGLAQWIQCKFGKQCLLKYNNCRQSGLYVDQTQSRREAPLAMQVPKMTVFCFLVCRFLTPTPQAAAVPPVQSLFNRALPSHQQLLLSPAPLPIHPNHNFDKEQHTAQGCAVARIPRTGLQYSPLLTATLILPIFRQQHPIQV